MTYCSTLTNWWTRVVAPSSRQASSAARRDAVAATVGPGLIGALLVGVAHAKALASGADMAVIDLEDAIAQDNKDKARAALDAGFTKAGNGKSLHAFDIAEDEHVF